MAFTPRTWGHQHHRLVPRRQPPRRRAAEPRLERLEHRTVLSTLTVLNNSDSGLGSLRAAIAAATPGATIVFAPNVHNITLTSGELTINKSLDIEGPGADKLTISGNDASRVFDISGAATTTVTIAGLTIAHGSAIGLGIDHSPSDLGGGGILNEAHASLTLSQSVLTNNTATASSGTVDVFGGGLLNEGSATVTSCIFSGNKALGGGGTSFFGGSVGGAIDNFGTGTVGRGAMLTVTGSTFVGNQAIGGADGGFYGIGGAIENNAGFKYDSPSTANISNSTFTNNLATAGFGGFGNGGAIDNEGTGATMTLTNSRLIDNQSIGGYGANGLGGGIVNAQGSTLIVTNSTFIGNQAIGGDSKSTPTFAFGGGLNNTSAGLTVSDSSFFGNKALTHSPDGVAVGGGLENGFYYVSGEGLELELINCTLSGNQAIGVGAAQGLAAGGGLDNSFGATATIKDSQIINNQALGGAGGPGDDGGAAVGGGISVGSSTLPSFGSSDDASSLTVTNSTIASNTARGGNGGSMANGGDGQGGGIWFGLDSTGTLALDNSVITGNFALGGQAGAGGKDGQGSGGDLYITSGDVVDVTPATKVKGNHASTSNDNIFRSP